MIQNCETTNDDDDADVAVVAAVDGDVDEAAVFAAGADDDDVGDAV